MVVGYARRQCAGCGRWSLEAPPPDLRVFEQFALLEVGADKMVLSRPAHQLVTPTVGRFLAQQEWKYDVLQ